MTDITHLNHRQATEYRRELLHAIYHPGLEFDLEGAQGKIDRDAYLRKVADLDVYIRSLEP